MTVLISLLAALLGVGAGAPHAASAHRHHHAHHRTGVPPKFFGVQPGPTRLEDRDGAKIAKTGVGTVRVGLDWSWVQAKPGPYTWTRADENIAPLAAHGVQALPTLAGTPPWVASLPTTAPVKGTDAKQGWKKFVTAAVRRYGPNGAYWRPGPLGGESPFHVQCGCNAPPVPITRWQVWNEPNLTHYYTPRPSPSKYATLLRITHSAIRQADPKAKIILAGLSNGGQTENDIDAVSFLKKLYRIIPKAKRSFDAVAIHPYSRRVGNMRALMDRVRRTLDQRHARRTPLYITEFGWGSAAPNGFGTTKGIRGQRKIVKKSLTMLLHHRKAWRLKSVYWFFWRDPPKSTGRLPCRICHSAGLVRNNFKPKPAYRAYKELARRAR